MSEHFRNMDGTTSIIGRQNAVRLVVNSKPALAAIAELSVLAEQSPDLRQRIFDLLLAPAQLVRVNSDAGAAAGAGEFGVVLEPSDSLRDFLAAARAGNFDGV